MAGTIAGFSTGLLVLSRHQTPDLNKDDKRKLVFKKRTALLLRQTFFLSSLRVDLPKVGVFFENVLIYFDN